VKVAGMADVGSEEATGAPWEFPSKSVAVRMAVIAAGPLMNFLFAFLAFFVLYGAYGVDTVDTTAISPVRAEAGQHPEADRHGGAVAESVAAAAGVREGDVVLAVDGRVVTNAHELFDALDASDGEGAVLRVDRAGELLDLSLPAAPDGDYGIAILFPTTVGRVVENMPAAGIGLQEGDRILAVNGQPVASWSHMADAINGHPDEPILLRWERDGQVLEAQVTPEGRDEDGERIGLIGIGPRSSTATVDLPEATRLAAVSVYTSSYLILDFIGQVFQEERYKELGGPIRIAKMAGDTAQRGLKHFLSFLALLSVNLAILNLLPIPVLDGGHLTFLTLEVLLGRPLSIRQREIAQQVGLAIILCIMVLVTFNDLNQLVFHHIAELFQ
jgi:regulator of sigma E protease